MERRKKVIFSGIQPTGSMHLGNYIGAVRNWRLLEDEYDCLYSIVDLHSLTIRQDPRVLPRRCQETLALLLAVGLRPEKSLIYYQSHVPAHAELAWILNCFTYLGELQRMTQFKDKSQKHAGNLNAGLFTYPVLMAADILLYRTDLVPIGADQKQHLELARDVAIRFNNAHGDTFTVPEGYFPKVGARVMSLLEPERKMSKSDHEDTCVALLDPPDVIRRKIKRAVTDSEGSVRFDPEAKPGVSNLMSILGALTGQTVPQVEAAFQGKGYGALKSAVTDAVVDALAPIQQAYGRLMADSAYLLTVARDSARRAADMAAPVMGKVRENIGLVPLP